MKRIFSFLLKLGVGFGILLVLFTYIPYSRLLRLLEQANLGLITAAFLISLIAYGFGTLRWQVLLRSKGSYFSFKELFLLGWCSLFFNLFFPSLIAADAFRTIALSARDKDRKKIFSTVIMDRFSGLLGSAIVAFGAYCIGRRSLNSAAVATPLKIFIIVVFIISSIVFSRKVFAFLMSWSKKEQPLIRKIRELHEHLYYFKKSPKAFLLSLVYSLFIQGIAPVCAFLLFRAFGSGIEFTKVLIIIPLVLAISSIPVTISGIGTREAAMVYFFLNAGIVDKEIPLAVSLFLFLFVVVVALAGGIVYLLFYQRWLNSNKLRNL